MTSVLTTPDGKTMESEAAHGKFTFMSQNYMSFLASKHANNYLVKDVSTQTNYFCDVNLCVFNRHRN